MDEATLREALEYVRFSIYYSGDQNRKMRWVGHITRVVYIRGTHRILVGEDEGKRPLGRTRG